MSYVKVPSCTVVIEGVKRLKLFFAPGRKHVSTVELGIMLTCVSIEIGTFWRQPQVDFHETATFANWFNQK